ncbi:MAG: DUF1611 domain-containing protein [Planctomycetota bacterium]
MTSTSNDRRLVILTQGHSDPITAKTASSVIRYRPEQVVAVLDASTDAKTSQDLLGVGGDIPVIDALDDAADANALMIGIAPPGGKIPSAWRPIVLGAIERGMNVVSGLHDFLSDDAEFVAAAEKSGVQLVDVRKNDEHDVANRQGIRDDCLRVLTIGHDCCVGKMVVAIELDRGLRKRGHDSKFVATGQTGILIEGDGCPIDCVVSDFINGSVEKLVLANQHHDTLLFEGQGSLAHPRYSAVTLGLLHGCLPQAMILCYEVGRTEVNNMDSIPLRSLSQLRDAYQTVAELMMPSTVIGVAMNSRLVDDKQAEAERERVRNELGLPVCDVIRHGADDLIDAIEAMRP